MLSRIFQFSFLISHIRLCCEIQKAATTNHWLREVSKLTHKCLLVFPILNDHKVLIADHSLMFSSATVGFIN